MKNIELTEDQKKHANIKSVKKVFQYEDLSIIIASCIVEYMNGKEKIELTKVIAPNGGNIPVRFDYKETLKSIQEKTINALNDFKKRGADVKNELTRTLSL